MGTWDGLHQAIGILDTLMIVEAIGASHGIDPAKPGVGPNAKAIYDGTALKLTERRLTGPVRNKLRAIRRFGAVDTDWDPVEGHERFSTGLSSARFHALVLDYDGTVVSTGKRLDPPDREIILEFERLLEAGLPIGFATGRGGSAGEVLRDNISSRFHSSILMGYYNGGYLRRLDVDIRHDPPQESAVIAKMSKWVAERNHLLPKPGKSSGVQISIGIDRSANSRQFIDELKKAPLVLANEVTVVFSEHSVDIGLPNNSKLNVVRSFEAPHPSEPTYVLCVGDSGSVRGNDYELLGHSHGISVRDVCHREDVCWSLFDGTVDGPDALLRILRALGKVSDGFFQLDVQKLSLQDTH